MIKEINQQINNINKKIGLGIEIPMPSNAALEINEKINTATSVTCLIIGTATASEWLISIGLLSGLSAAFTHVEKKSL